MFSPGNVSEKARVARLPAAGETVVDLYAGIGYWTLPLLLHARAAHVHACDWNPDALASLRINLARNGVPPSRFTLWPGDNQQLLGQPAVLGSADRVMLGLIPTAQRGYGVAMRALKPAGGWLHVHANKGEAEAEDWERDLPGELLVASAAAYAAVGLPAPAWQARVAHVERVKSYAPRVWHLVADVWVSAAPQP
jgi:tRNA G37 N-methylase Trm5